MDPNQVTIVTACRNRLESLQNVIDSWVGQRPAEIIICDWGSKIPLKLSDFDYLNYGQIRILRFESSRWILTWAFNEVLHASKTPFTLKLDCEYRLSSNFLEIHNCKPNGYIRGNWRFVSNDHSQSHINGAFLACSKLLSNIGYFDERITTYGWDDSDIYERMSDWAASSDTFKLHSITHIDQAEETRTESQQVKKEELLANFSQVSVPEFMITRNRFFVKSLWPWNHNMFKNRQTFRDSNSPQNRELEAYTEFANISAFETYNWPKLKQNSSLLTLYKQALSKYSKNLDFDLSLSTPTVFNEYVKALKAGNNELSEIILNSYVSAASTEKLKNQRLNRLSKARDIVINNHFYIRPMHGLGNRLRVIASAYHIAKAANKALVICWDQDEHMACQFEDIFDPSSLPEGVFISTSSDLVGINPAYNYNYMENDQYTQKGLTVKTDPSLPTICTSSSVLESSDTDWQLECKFLQDLHYSNEVKSIIDKYIVPESYVGVHIRYDGEDWESLAHENSNHWNKTSHETLKNWREKSKPIFFAKRMKKLIESSPQTKFFIAGSKPESIKYMKDEFKDNIFYVDKPNNYYGRDRESIIYALVDLHFLSRARLLLGSGWSSFTELAQRLKPPSINQVIEISGVDFF